MSNLWRRSKRVMKSWLQDLAEPAADPRQTYQNAFERQRGLLLKVQQALAEIGHSKNRLQAKVELAQSKLPRLQERALSWLSDGREDLARLALQRRQLAAVELQTLREQVQEVEKEELRLSLIEQRLSTQIEAFYARQEMVAARYSAAEAQVRIQEAYSGVSEELAGLGKALADAEEKSERMEARVSAIDRLVTDGILDAPSADAAMRQLTQLDAAFDVDQQMEQLKRQLDSPADRIG